jgi:hypothetical protein
MSIEEGIPMNDIVLPIRSSLRKMINIAGTQKPYVSKYALSYICSAWAWNGNKDDIGASAIPYRQDIAKLLIHKEAKLDEATSHKEDLVQNEYIQEKGGFCILSSSTPDTSIARGFVLTFLSSLPNAEDGLNPMVKSKLCYYLILWLMDEICLQDQVGSMLVGGSFYCQVLRAWQSLCLLSRFVTEDIVDLVCERVFKAMVSFLCLETLITYRILKVIFLHQNSHEHFMVR